MNKILVSVLIIVAFFIGYLLIGDKPNPKPNLFGYAVIKVKNKNMNFKLPEPKRGGLNTSA